MLCAYQEDEYVFHHNYHDKTTPLDFCTNPVNTGTIVTSFWRDNDVIITSCVRLVYVIFGGLFNLFSYHLHTDPEIKLTQI